MNRLVGILMIVATFLPLGMSAHNFHYALVRLDVDTIKQLNVLRFKITKEDYREAEELLSQKGVTMKEYILSTITVKSSGVAIVYKFVEKTEDNGAVWLSYESDNLLEGRSVIQLTLFNGLFKEQQNFFVLNYVGNEQACMFNSQKTIKTFSL